MRLGRSFKRARVTGAMRRRVFSKRGVSRAPQRMFRARGWASRTLNTHRFSRYAATAAYPNMTVSGIESSTSHVFALQDIVNADEFGALFDQYRIDKVIVTYQLLNNPSAANALNTLGNNPSGTNWYPTVWSMVDYDDAATTNIEEMKQRIGVKRQIMRPDKIIRFIVRPKLQVQVYKTALTTGYAPKSMFVDMTTRDISHYGLKTVIDTSGLDPNDSYPFVIRQTRQYFFTCKNVR